ncbi:AcrR family transcriptional regulator [Kribbella aluminosa]|uniref:AcrR family transcriptional regulator n=1 Tax=Kribbella aluminosa TaxID=416017 RepID=A0ABS4UJ67_9ACTN|nr:TetR family transcriptional regulator [Kribbella aluminosa]MBP2351696.1 AcrR family transcriptional regulator [Kribbella aluminosa]
MSVTGRGRGRPPVADEGELRARAIDVMLRHGYENVTMALISDELGVSVRTLHRYFPAKPDIVWGGIEGSLEALRAALAQADERAPIIEAITSAVVAVFGEDADQLAVTRARIRLIASTPKLEATRPDTYRHWREETVAYIARRLATPADGVVPRAVGAAVQTAIMEALAWWASRSESTAPVEAVRQALQGIRQIADP